MSEVPSGGGPHWKAALSVFRLNLIENKYLDLPIPDSAFFVAAETGPLSSGRRKGPGHMICLGPFLLSRPCSLAHFLLIQPILHIQSALYR